MRNKPSTKQKTTEDYKQNQTKSIIRHKIIDVVLHLIRIIDGSLFPMAVMARWFVTIVLSPSLPLISLSGTARYIVFMKPLELSMFDMREKVA